MSENFDFKKFQCPKPKMLNKKRLVLLTVVYKYFSVLITEGQLCKLKNLFMEKNKTR